MAIRSIEHLTEEQRERLADVEEAIVDQDMAIEVYGLHPILDDIIGEVYCPYDGFKTKDMIMISLFVFNQAPRLKLDAEKIAAEYAVQRDASYGM